MFLVVETINDNGEKEWKVAPKRWVCTTRNTRRTVLLWPNEISSERQKHLAKEGVCKPMKSWSRKECTVKQECPTYGAANTAMKTLMVRCLPPKSSRTKNHPLCNDNRNRITQQSKISIGVSDVVASEPPAKQDLPESKVSMLVSIKMMVETLMKRHECIEKQNARIETQNAEIEEQNIRIENESADLKKTLEIMQKRLAILGAQQTPTEDLSMESSSFYFEPAKTFAQLNELENELNNEAFRSKMVAWLTFNIVGKNLRRRMSSCLDLLFSPELLTKCSWIGVHRNGIEKPALKDIRNVLKLFKVIGSTPHKKMDDKEIAIFFKQKLKCAKYRLLRYRERAQQTQAEDKLVNLNEPVYNIEINHIDSSNTLDHTYAELVEDTSETPFEVEILH
ncbi:uncharacterized protein LOC118457643 [Anopheles albimanus]|uniref:uncharacterized protein LOC118457643 n=1 Tax=Anopheles albimanus TaxID=7167 RepID=UPI00164084D4|nr:uncharacterized protein LOC118457643 [Anopheles albimanus]